MKIRSGSYANVASTLALVVALGGASYAAVTVTGKDVKDGSLTGKDLARNSVSSPKVKNGSLKAKDFKSGELPAGPTGPAGATGATGPTGPRGPSAAFTAANTAPTSVQNITDVVTLSLPAGSYVLMAKATITNGYTAEVLTRCRLVAGTSEDVARGSLTTPTAPGGNTQTLPMLLTHTFAAAGTAVLRCENFNAPATSEHARITAVQVASITP